MIRSSMISSVYVILNARYCSWLVSSNYSVKCIDLNNMDKNIIILEYIYNVGSMSEWDYEYVVGIMILFIDEWCTFVK